MKIQQTKETGRGALEFQYCFPIPRKFPTGLAPVETRFGNYKG